ncbi:MAG: hypothetical protein PHW52_01385 [Candidatus Pacebacteria bacterium]|nr:hypothetical protein [Candidatus Paceibacterota bacterium]
MWVKKTEEELEAENQIEEEDDEREAISEDEIISREASAPETNTAEKKKDMLLEKIQSVFRRKDKKGNVEEPTDNTVINAVTLLEEKKKAQESGNDRIKQYVEIALEKGIEPAMNQLKKEKPFSPFNYDLFHDMLLEEIKKKKENGLK